MGEKAGKLKRKWIAAGLGIVLILQGLEPGLAFGESAIWGEKDWQNSHTASSSDGRRLASRSNAKLQTNSLGDIWREWNGKSSFEFLDGTQGNGSKEKPFLIENKEQLMGLSQLTAMGMMVPESGEEEYVGNYSGCSFALAGDIDLQGIDWIPIGFYRDSSEASGTVLQPFRGNFNGNGYEIRNLKLNHMGEFNCVGLFGFVENSVIENMTIVPASEIRGKSETGILAGRAENSVIREVKVQRGAVRSSGICGGVSGVISRTVVENAVCDNITIDSSQGEDVIYAGGIAGTAAQSVIADCQVSTGDNLTARIQGTGYIGGITGFQNGTDVFNVYVSGTIGGYGSLGIGGITGQYASGKIKVARFDGTIGNSRLGAMAREGTFIGTRHGATSNFNYGDDVEWLFADTAGKISANVCGSGISDDNDFTYDAHIGYWHEADLSYTLMQGGSQKHEEGKYFYQVLEEGILKIMDEEQAKEYEIDHYAPDSVGRPVRGYLVTVAQVDTIAGGKNFYDVASLQARGSSLYSHILNKENRGAIAAGSAVAVTTVPNHTEQNKFQLSGLPYYMGAAGSKSSIPYEDSSHAYVFSMPEENIVIGADYTKVAASIDVKPEEYRFQVIQTRNGNRKNPGIVTEILDDSGKLLARYINGQLENGTKVTLTSIEAVVDAANDVSDSRIKWSVDNPKLIVLEKNDDEEESGYTAKSASVSVNPQAPFFTEIIEEQERLQEASGYRYRIPDTVYGTGHDSGGTAILTASTRPSASFEGKPCRDSCRIWTTFQVVDNTMVAAESSVLDKQEMEFVVKRTLTGNRLDPQEKITVTGPQTLSAVFEPDYFSRADVNWNSSDSQIVTVQMNEEDYREALVAVRQDAPWIRHIVEQDNGMRESDPYGKINGKGERSSVVTVTAQDRLGNRTEDQCRIRVSFVTEDKTEIIPEGIELDSSSITLNLVWKKQGDSSSETVERTGFDPMVLKAAVRPELDSQDIHTPYERQIIWNSSDPDIIQVDEQGRVTVREESQWLEMAAAQPPYAGEKQVEVTARTAKGDLAASCRITVRFQVECVEAEKDREEFDIVLIKTGRRSSPVLTYEGAEGKIIKAQVYNGEKEEILWKSGDESLIRVDKNGKAVPVVLDDQGNLQSDWISKILEQYPYTGTMETVVYAGIKGEDIWDPVSVVLNFRVIDNTKSSSGNSSFGGGASSGSSTGITPSGTARSSQGDVGALSGIWTQAADGRWLFTAERTYVNEWAYINNPYAGALQPKASWFRFDANGYMVTGWFLDGDGNWYYLNPLSDGTKGKMIEGWHQIQGEWYYFNPVSDGTRGKLMVNTVIQGIYPVDADGKWICE